MFAYACGLPASLVGGARPLRSLSMRMSSAPADRQGGGLAAWPSVFDNSLLRDLKGEPPDAPPHKSRQVFGAHYTLVRPTVTAPRPVLIAWSAPVAESLGLKPEDSTSEAFLSTFSGSPPESFECWATAYGASFTGQYGGQRGDGRAISIGQCAGLEVQLKGAGTTPYSRPLPISPRISPYLPTPPYISPYPRCGDHAVLPPV